MNTENYDLFSKIQVVKKISTGKFQVFLTQHEGKQFALKVFPHQDNKISKYYLNEARFSGVSHDNIIKVAAKHDETTTLYNGKPCDSSVILMEYAQHGTLSDAVLNNRNLFKDEKLIRTYFHQLLDAIEYLHHHDVFHLDIKPDNVLIGDNFQAKVADFDLSFVAKQDKRIVSKGTKYYRAPEIADGACKDPASADIYSLGVILFVLKTAGSLPHIENNIYNGVNYFNLLKQSDKSEYWTQQCLYLKKREDFFSEDFKNLFASMVDIDPTMRPTIREIRKCDWFNGPVYTKQELASIASKQFNSKKE